MSEKIIKNMEHESVLNLAEQVTILPGQVVSKTLAQSQWQMGRHFNEQCFVWVRFIRV